LSSIENGNNWVGAANMDGGTGRLVWSFVFMYRFDANMACGRLSWIFVFMYRFDANMACGSMPR
jgi:hypothetical protein